MGMLYLVRHGQSLANEQRICSGSIGYNIGLSKLGVAQAEALGKLVKDYPIDLLVTSRLKRAKNTADAMLWHFDNQPPRAEASAFDERSLGIVESRPIAEVIETYGKETYDSWFTEVNAAPPRGESMFQLHSRVVPFFVNSVEPMLYDENKNIMLVAHMSVLQVLSTHLEGTPLGEFASYQFDNCGISAYNLESEN